MFGGGSRSHQNQAASTIKEANVHIEALSNRCCDLELRIREQAELLDLREEEYQSRQRILKRSKDEEIAALKQEMAKMQQRCGHLESIVKERDCQIAFLMHRCSFLDEAASYVPLLDGLTNCLKGAYSIAPVAKVHSVKPTRNQQPAASSSAKNFSGDEQPTTENENESNIINAVAIASPVSPTVS